MRHTASYAQRFTAMGDKAEAKFEQQAASGVGPFPKVVGFDRAGLNRPEMNEKKLPRRVRNCPDYRTEIGWVEVKGCGRDQILKIRVGQYVDLAHYDEDTYPVWVFVYDSFKRRTTLVPLTKFQKLIDAGLATLETFHDGRAYFGFPTSELFS